MEVKEFYTIINGDYEGTLSRLLNDERIKKYLLKVPESGDYEEMIKGIQENNQEKAFLYSHNLKGICLNLGITKLADSSSRLCEEYRNNIPDHDISNLINEVKEDYLFTISNIKELD